MTVLCSGKTLFVKTGSVLDWLGHCLPTCVWWRKPGLWGRRLNLQMGSVFSYITWAALVLAVPQFPNTYVGLTAFDTQGGPEFSTGSPVPAESGSPHHWSPNPPSPPSLHSPILACLDPWCSSWLPKPQPQSILYPQPESKLTSVNRSSRPFLKPSRSSHSSNFVSFAPAHMSSPFCSHPHT